MKRLHRPDFFGWSVFDEARNIDFHGVLWVRDGGNVVIDPVEMCDHDQRHLESLGAVATVIITNSDHVRDAPALARRTGATLYGPAKEREAFPVACSAWLDDGDEPVSGLKVLALHGSKTPGELALVIEHTTLVTGDLVRAHEGGQLTMLPPAKLADPAVAAHSVRRLAGLPGIDAVLPGDGWPVFRNGGALLAELAARLDAGT